MSISPVSGGGSRSADIVELLTLHTAMQDRLDGTAVPAPAGRALPAANGALPSAALMRPTYRPAYLGRAMPTRGGKPGAGRHRPQGEVEAAEPPGWERMAPGERGREAIPAGDRFGVPIQAEVVRGQHVGAEAGEAPRQSAQRQPDASWIATAAGALVRPAILGRARWMACMARQSSAAPLQAAVFSM